MVKRLVWWNKRIPRLGTETWIRIRATRVCVWSWTGGQCTLVATAITEGAADGRVLSRAAEAVSFAVVLFVSLTASNLNLRPLFYSSKLLIFSQKPILIELLHQTSFSSLKLLPFDNILIVTKASMQKIRNVLWFTSLPHPQKEVWDGGMGAVGCRRRFWEKREIL